jgi:hypothetical protein
MNSRPHTRLVPALSAAHVCLLLCLSSAYCLQSVCRCLRCVSSLPVQALRELRRRAVQRAASLLLFSRQRRCRDAQPARGGRARGHRTRQAVRRLRGRQRPAGRPAAGIARAGQRCWLRVDSDYLSLIIHCSPSSVSPPPASHIQPSRALPAASPFAHSIDSSAARSRQTSAAAHASTVSTINKSAQAEALSLAAVSSPPPSRPSAALLLVYACCPSCCALLAAAAFLASRSAVSLRIFSAFSCTSVSGPTM